MDNYIVKIREEILKSMFNDNTLKILNQIMENNDSVGNTLLITKLDLTRKQFYTRLNELTTKGLIKKEKGKYYITTFGKIIYEMTTEFKNKLGSLIEERWKFKAIDLLDISDELTTEERDKIINHLFNEMHSDPAIIHSDPAIIHTSSKKEISYFQHLKKNNYNN